MGYKITTLVENCVYGRKLQAEHGLSLYIETSGHRLLFDTGASDLFIRNARLLHIDLQKVDYLILSHGHSDHTGGPQNNLPVLRQYHSQRQNRAGNGHTGRTNQNQCTLFRESLSNRFPTLAAGQAVQNGPQCQFLFSSWSFPPFSGGRVKPAPRCQCRFP